jgi:sec-independent protein translocase protein TatA
MLMHILLFGIPNGPELWLILLGVLLLFGGKKIPELMRGLGQGIREFNDAKGKVKQSLEDGMRRPEEPKTESK